MSSALLHDVQAKNPETWFKFAAHPNTGVFRAAFVSFGPAATLLRSFGRNVSGADFGHSSSPVFEGVYAIGMHQTGSGVLIPLCQNTRYGRVVITALLVSAMVTD